MSWVGASASHLRFGYGPQHTYMGSGGSVTWSFAAETSPSWPSLPPILSHTHCGLDQEQGQIDHASMRKGLELTCRPGSPAPLLHIQHAVVVSQGHGFDLTRVFGSPIRSHRTLPWPSGRTGSSSLRPACWLVRALRPHDSEWQGIRAWMVSTETAVHGP